MSTETALIPVRDYKATVYMNRRQRALRLLIRWGHRISRSPFMTNLTRNIVEDFTNGRKRARRTVAWLWSRVARIARYVKRYAPRKGQHRRDLNQGEVNRSTPDQARTYPIRTPIVKVRTKDTFWTRPDDQEVWAKKIQRDLNNARMILTNAKGPLAP